ncbi:MAG: ornithine cyclodeaminase [Rhodobacteraceae bacterium]|nr:ornithine cyclodeaminase [Paracoccaceae bacterium]
MNPDIVGFAEGEAGLNWPAMANALAAGHKLPRAEIRDTLIRRGDDTLLNRSAWIDGLGMAVKVATIFPGNTARGMPSVGGAVSLFNDRDGSLDAMIDFHLVTKWKTAADSLLAAMRLARPDSRTILIVGAGTVAATLVAAYSSVFKDARFLVWNRTAKGAARLAAQHANITVAADLAAAVAQADIITCATMATSPVLRGTWLRPGQHIDLIGAYRPDMREADDTALQRARIFVDSRETVLEHIGELRDPLRSGAITAGDIIADYYQPELFTRQNDSEITLFKNGGGAHLDLMTARYILDIWRQRQ